MNVTRPTLATLSAPAVRSHSPVLDQARLVTAPVCPTSLWPPVTRVSVSTRPAPRRPGHRIW